MLALFTLGYLTCVHVHVWNHSCLREPPHPGFYEIIRKKIIQVVVVVSGVA